MPMRSGYSMPCFAALFRASQRTPLPSHLQHREFRRALQPTRYRISENMLGIPSRESAQRSFLPAVMVRGFYIRKKSISPLHQVQVYPAMPEEEAFPLPALTAAHTSPTLFASGGTF